MESNCPVMPDSSSHKPIAIPDGWRELEPDEMPKSTDMHEWMGGWFYRNDDATHEYKWHSSRHIRKIEPANTSETPNSSTATAWIPKVGDKVRVVGLGLCGEIKYADGIGDHCWLVLCQDSSYRWLSIKGMELIEAAS